MLLRDVDRRTTIHRLRSTISTMSLSLRRLHLFLARATSLLVEAGVSGARVVVGPHLSDFNLRGTTVDADEHDAVKRVDSSTSPRHEG